MMKIKNIAEKQMTLKMAGFGRILVFLTLMFLLDNYSAWAGCTCETGTRGSFIGTELTAKQCPPEDAGDNTRYTYIHKAIKCSGGKIALFSSWGDTTGTPASITAFHASNGMRVFQNEKGTHIIAVHPNFNGKINGLSMTAYAPGSITVTNAMSQQCAGLSDNNQDNDQDGVPACLDCDDNNSGIGYGVEDGDNDRVRACNDCDDADGQIKSGKGIDANNNGIDACKDCDESKENSPNICISCPTTVGQPVNYFTGVMTHDLDLLDLPGAPVPLSFTLKYDSHQKEEEPFGRGWTHNQAVHLKISPNLIAVADRSQRPPVFVTYDNGTTFYPAGITRGSLAKSDDHYLYTLPNADTWAFDLSGRILKKTDPHGLATIYEYNTAGQLVAVTDPSGRTLRLAYYPSSTPAQGLVMAVEDPAGNQFRFAYTARLLSSVVYPDGDDDPGNNPKGFFYYDDFPDEGLTNGGNTANMTKLLDTRGNALSWSYDERDRAVLTSGPQGANRLELTYQSPDTTVVVNSRSNATTYSFDQGTGTHTRTGSGCGTCPNIMVSKYNQAGRLIEKQDGNGYITQYRDFDQNGNPGTIIRAAGTAVETRTHYTYHPKFNKITSRKEKGTENLGDHETVYTYHQTTGDLLSLSKKGFSSGAYLTLTTGYSYNDRGQPTLIDGPRKDVNDIIEISYDGDTGFIQSITQSLAGTTVFSDYTELGYPAAITDPNGNVHRFVYDRQGRVLDETVSDGGTTRYEYDTVGNLIRVTLPAGNVLEYGYDHADRLTLLTDSLGNEIRYSFDSAGNMTRQEIRDNKGVLKRYLDFEYDTHDRLWKIIYPDNTFEEYGYDSSHNQILHINPAGRDTRYTYDEYNRMSSQTNADGVIRYEYDSSRNLSSVEDPNGNITSNQYDDFGRLLSKISPDTGKILFEYDESGNLVQKIDARGLLTAYEYDALNRITAVRYPDSLQDITYTYDEGTNGKGRLTSIRDASGTTAYLHGRSGRVAKEIKTVSNVRYVTSYAYDLNGNLKSLTYPDGSMVRYVYDANQLKKVVAEVNNQQIVLSDAMGFEPFGSVNHMALNCGIDYSITYDARNRPSQITAGSMLNRQYRYAPAGNIDQIIDNISQNKTQTFVYDDMNRLKQAAGVYGTIDYHYDPAGNRTSRTADTGTDTYTYIPGTNLLSQITGINTRTFAYDNAGNMIKKDKTTQVYNTAGRLIRIIENNTLKSEYTYNGLGQRIKKRSADETQIYHYDIAGNIIAVSDTRGRLKEKIIYANGQRIAKIDLVFHPLDVGDVNADSLVDAEDALMVEKHLVGIILLTQAQLIQADVTLDGNVTAHDAMVIKQITNKLRSLPPGPATETVYYYINDHLGTPLALLDQNGVKVWEANYLPFGQIMTKTGTIPQAFRYPGQYFDAETGNHYNWHRYYDPMTGRYITADPIGLAGGINPFVYSENNPINFIDPLGLDTWTGASVEADVAFILFGGYSRVLGWLTNRSTGEKCYYETTCKKVGFGIMAMDLSGSGNVVLNGPEQGQDLAGTSVGMGLDIGPVALAGSVDSNAAVNVAAGGGIGPLPGSGAMNAMVCKTRIIRCENTPCKQGDN